MIYVVGIPLTSGKTLEMRLRKKEGALFPDWVFTYRQEGDSDWEMEDFFSGTDPGRMSFQVRSRLYRRLVGSNGLDEGSRWLEYDEWDREVLPIIVDTFESFHQPATSA